MIQITHPKINDFVNEHYYAVIEYYNRDNKKTPKSDIECINKWLKNNLNQNFEYIIKATPSQIKYLIDKLKSANNYPDCIERLRNMYQAFSSPTTKLKDKSEKSISKKDYYNSVKLVKKLGITVCPYCNREYIFKFEDTKKQESRVLATFDHFYDKKRYPFLALSFYNLIPSCSTCNSKFKTTVNFFEKKHLHPYEDDFNSLAKFSLKIKKPNFYYSTDGIDIELKENNKEDKKTKNTILTFRLEDIYKEHSDIALEIIKKHYVYSEDYLEILYKQYEGTLFKNYEQLKGILFGNFISNDEINKRPLAKFTKDILSDLE